MYDKNFYTHENSLLIGLVLLGDIIISTTLYVLFNNLFNNSVPEIDLRQILLTNAIVYLMCTANRGVVLYKRKVTNFDIVAKVNRNIVMYAIFSFIVYKAGDYDVINLDPLALYWLSMIVLISVFRLIIRYFVKVVRSSSQNISKVVLVGSSANNIALYEEMAETPSLGCRVMGYFDDKQNNKMSDGKCPYLGSPKDVINYLENHNDISELYCCLPSARKDDILPIIRFCTKHFVHFYSVPNVSNYLHHRMHFNMLGSVPYLSLYNEPLMRVENRIIKRLFDIVFSLTFLCTLFPFIFIIVAIITKTTMPGPIFFRQKRNGINGKEFYCLKFRSMKVNAQSDTLQATKDDPRKTKWGNIMRKTSIDELPQFINVLLGQMSVVGPRPHMVNQTIEYSKIIDTYMVRHFVKPGITGWSQVTGFRGETKELSQMEQRVKHDIWYIEHWSIWLDLYIIYKTVANAIKGDDEAY